MKNKIIWLVVAVVVVGGVFALRNKNSNPKSSTLRVGAAVPLTGNYASIGENIKKGFDLAKEQIESENSGMNVEIVYEDACLPKDITSAVQKLVNVDQLKIVNQFCAIGLVPSMEITEPNKVINVGVAANVSDLLGKKYYFSPNFSVEDNANTLAEFAINKLKAKKVAFIFYNTQFGKDYRKYIGERIVESGGQIVADEMTSLETTDFRSHLIKVKNSKPDVIFVTQLTGALGTIIKQSKDMGIDAPLVGNYQNEDPIVLSVAGEAAEGFIISSADPMILSQNFSAFKSSFNRKYNIDPDVFASNAYDALKLEFEVFKKCGEDTDCMMDNLHKIVGYNGVSGSISIDENGFSSKPTIFKIVKGGKFVNLEQ